MPAHAKASTEQLIESYQLTKSVWKTADEFGMCGLSRYGNPARPHGSWKSGWRQVGDQRIYARSRWEANYARYLETLRVNGTIRSWEHEPVTFWFVGVKRGCCSYLPDFRVTDAHGIVSFHEVKGWMDARSLTKLKRMKKYHPNVALVLIDKLWFKANGRQLSVTIPNWEHDK